MNEAEAGFEDQAGAHGWTDATTRAIAQAMVESEAGAELDVEVEWRQRQGQEQRQGPERRKEPQRNKQVSANMPIQRRKAKQAFQLVSRHAGTKPSK